MKRVILVDAKNLLFRAHFSHLGLKSDDGQPTSVLFGFPSLLLDIEKKIGPSDIVIVWDDGLHGVKRKKGSTRSPGIWRKQIAPEVYKANREPNPETEIAMKQMPALVQLLELVGYLQIGVHSLEADDLMGICAKALGDRPTVKQVYILSNDRDHYQLVGDKTMILYPAKTGLKILDEEAVVRETGVWPFEWAKFKAFAGDSSDSYKAIKGIGPKTAIALLRAGLDPSLKLFQRLPPHVQDKYQGFRQYWPAVHKCFILSQIPTTPSFKYFPADVQSECEETLKTVVFNRERRFTEASLDKRLRDLIGYLGRYGMTHLIARKREFFQGARIL